MQSHHGHEGARLDAQLLSDLWVFRAAAQLHSITAAAQQLNVTQGAVSQRVLRLESRLGVELFKRHKGRIALTEAGSILLEAMDVASSRVDDALGRIRRSTTSIVVTCSPSLATEWLMPKLQAFYRDCPGIELLVRAEIAPPSAKWMVEERIDVMIDYLHAQTSAPGLVELVSVQEYTFPVCSRTYRDYLFAQAPMQPQAILLHDDAAWQEGETAGAEWQEWRDAVPREHHVRVSGDQHFNLAYLAYQAAIYGQGLAMGRSISINRLIREEALVAAMDVAPVPSASYRVFALSAIDEGSPISRFACWLAEALAETQAETLSMVEAMQGVRGGDART